MSSQAHNPPETAEPDNVRLLPSADADRSLFELEGAALAAALYDRFGADVNRVIRSLLGPDPDHDDLVQKVFAIALVKMDGLRDRAAVRGWLVSIAANTTRTELRRRKRWRWMSLSPGDEAADVPVSGEDHEARALLAQFYDTVDKLAADERVIFIFRYVDERPLAEIAEICGCSVATVKRRLTKASDRFLRHAQHNPDLLARIRGGTTWGGKAGGLKP